MQNLKTKIKSILTRVTVILLTISILAITSTLSETSMAVCTNDSFDQDTQPLSDGSEEGEYKDF